MIASPGIGDEDDFWLPVVVEVLTCVILVKNHAEPSNAKHYAAGPIVNCRRALVAPTLAVARGAERNLVSVPKFFRIGSILSFQTALSPAGNLALQVLRVQSWRKRRTKDDGESNSQHAWSIA